MRRGVALVLLALLAEACGPSLFRATDLVDLNGMGPGSSGNVTVTGSWNLVYSWDCSREASEGVTGIDRFDMIVYNTDDLSTAFEHPEVHLHGRKGGGTLRYALAGEYRADVDTPCDWRIQVVDTSSR